MGIELILRKANLKTMISMDIKQQILHFYRVEGLSPREISRRAGVDRKTVTRLINDYEAAIKANPKTGVDDFLASRPVNGNVEFRQNGFEKEAQRKPTFDTAMPSQVSERAFSVVPTGIEPVFKV